MHINWIASYPKSGNTFVRMLTSAYVTGHLDINSQLITEYDSPKYLYKALAPSDLDHDENIFLRPAVLLHMLASRKYSPPIVKTHWANIVVHGITAIPRKLTGSAVYLVRDPRDVCVSFARHIGKTVDQTIYEMSNHNNVMYDDESKVATYLTTWSEHVESWERDFVTVVRYEDLKADPEGEFARILKAFGIKVNLQRLRKAIRLTDIERLKIQERKRGFVEIGKQDKFFGQGKGWCNELTDKQSRRIEEDHGEVMQKYGYLCGASITKIEKSLPRTMETRGRRPVQVSSV